MKVDEVITEVVDQVRQQRTPVFVELTTFRYKEHVGPGEDWDAGYRSRADLEAWQAKDPLILDQEMVNKYQPMILEEIEEAVAFAESSPWPDQSQVLTDVI